MVKIYRYRGDKQWRQNSSCQETNFRAAGSPDAAVEHKNYDSEKFIVNLLVSYEAETVLT